jgi:hypothetical protein
MGVVGRLHITPYLAQDADFHEAHQSDRPDQALAAKIFLFLFFRNRGCLSPSRLDEEGRFGQSSRAWRRGAVDVDGA